MNKATTTRIVFGLLVIILGVLALLSALGAFNFGDVIGRYWPLLVIVGGLLLFINNPRQVLWPIISLILGVVFQLRQLDIIDFNVWQLFWPVIVIGLGLSIILNRSDRKLKPSDNNNTSVSVLFSGSDLKNHSEDYKGGNLSATLGGITLDLREAKIKKTATLNVFVLMGGIELTVPKEWKIQSNVTPILGGVDGRALQNPGSADAPTLIITGDVALGGIEIKH